MKCFAKQKWYLPIFLFLLIIPAACSKDTTEKTTTVSSTQTIKDLKESKVEDNKRLVLDAMKRLAKSSCFSGAVLEHRSGNTYTMYYGYKDKENDEKVTEKTIFPICSQAKIFCGIIIAQLIREQKLSYDSTLGQSFSDVEGAEKVTIRDLLSHTSGYENSEITPDYFLQDDEQLLEFTKDITVRSDSSESYYANSNFVFLALLAAKIEQKPYYNLVKERILNVLEMKNTYFPKDLKKSDLPVSYAVVEGKEYQYDETNYSLNLLSSLMGAGEICSTVTDMAKFFDGLSHKKLLTKEEYQTLFHPTKDAVYSAGLSLKESNKGFDSSLGSFSGQGIQSYYEGDENGEDYSIILTNMHNTDIAVLGDLFYSTTSDEVDKR
ncbi:MAG: beta-lactamase family protein [Elusimicrobiota bacterium]|jgi:CubicO group peptidase (beta-lactamase class C family)|nr:beta-lactamase family protein [Elusimicrobiota bacterium]